MYELIREENGKAVPFEWMAARQKAFETIKAKLATAPVVAHPDFNKPFILYTDVSGEGVGAVLHQKGENERERISACASRTYNEHEKKYPITEQECLAVIWGVEKFRQFLSVKPFKIITDHMALETIRTVDLPFGRRARWLCKLQQYDFTIEHKKGNRITHVDAFSRALEESHMAVQQPTRQHIPVALQKELRRRARQQTKPKFIMVVIYDEQGMRMSYRLKKGSM